MDQIGPIYFSVQTKPFSLIRFSYPNRITYTPMANMLHQSNTQSLGVTIQCEFQKIEGPVYYSTRLRKLYFFTRWQVQKIHFHKTNVYLVKLKRESAKVFTKNYLKFFFYKKYKIKPLPMIQAFAFSSRAKSHLAIINLSLIITWDSNTFKIKMSEYSVRTTLCCKHKITQIFSHAITFTVTFLNSVID